MREGRRRVLQRGRSMHERGRTKCRLAWIAEICEPGATIAERQSVLRRQLHEEIVRMLPIDYRLSLVCLTCLKQQGRSARRKSKRLGAEHAAQLECARAKFSIGHRHEPIRGLKLSGAAPAALMVHIDYKIVVQH